MSDSIPTVVIGSDGRVLAAAGGNLPDGLTDRLLADCAELPNAVREAGAALVAERRASNQGPRTRIVIAEAAGAIAVVAIDAVAIRREATDLRQLFAARLSALAGQADEAGVRLRIDVAADVPTFVVIDGEKIAWAVSTLVGNALRYVPASHWLGSSMIAVTATSQAASEVTIEVSDTGPGIPAADAARLLDRTPATPGRGLALLLIRDIVAAHGGRMTVVSSTESGRHGTTFRLTLPVH